MTCSVLIENDIRCASRKYPHPSEHPSATVRGESTKIEELGSKPIIWHISLIYLVLKTLQKVFKEINVLVLMNSVINKGNRLHLHY